MFSSRYQLWFSFADDDDETRRPASAEPVGVELKSWSVPHFRQTGSNCATARMENVGARAGTSEYSVPGLSPWKKDAGRSLPAEGGIRFQFLKYVIRSPQGRLHVFADVFLADDVLKFRLVDQLRRLFSRTA